MAPYIIRRIAGAFPVVLLVLVLNFLILHLAPGDPVFIFIQGGGEVTEEYVQQIRERLGLDKPLAEQFFIFIGNVFKGNLGFSHFYQQPVIKVIFERIGRTFLLVGLAILFAAILGISLGVLAASYPYSPIDYTNTVIAVFGYSIPTFWFGQLLILIFGVFLRVLPVGGVPIIRRGLLDWASHLVLPVTCLGVYQLALIARLTRANMREVLNMDYVMVARAKGLKEGSVILKHALRNASLPVVTAIGLNFASLLTGAVVTETVFGWPGLGRLMFESLYRRDYPVLLGLLIIMSIGVVIINLLVDVLYALLDPRIHYD
jgi:peptide/nickel transport system permease protein